MRGEIPVGLRRGQSLKGERIFGLITFAAQPVLGDLAIAPGRGFRRREVFQQACVENWWDVLLTKHLLKVDADQWIICLALINLGGKINSNGYCSPLTRS